MEKQALVSVIVPIFNGEKYIDRCLNSIVSQSYENIEIICVDDGSTDATLDKIEGIGDHRIRTLHHKSNEGPLISRVEGIKIAEGTFTMFVDVDDYLDVSVISEVLRIQEKFDADIVHFLMDISDDSNQDKKSHREMCNFSMPYFGELKGTDIFRHFLVDNAKGWNLWGKLYRTELCKKAKKHLINKNYIYGEDLLMFAYFVMEASKYIGINSECKYRYTMGSGTSTKGECLRIDMFYRICKLAEIYKEIVINSTYLGKDFDFYELKNSLLSSNLDILEKRIKRDEYELASKVLYDAWGQDSIGEIANIRDRNG